MTEGADRALATGRFDSLTPRHLALPIATWIVEAVQCYRNSLASGHMLVSAPSATLKYWSPFPFEYLRGPGYPRWPCMCILCGFFLCEKELEWERRLLGSVDISLISLLPATVFIIIIRGNDLMISGVGCHNGVTLWSSLLVCQTVKSSDHHWYLSPPTVMRSHIVCKERMFCLRDRSIDFLLCGLWL